MLQISQTENPMCSATIDQMRLRRAMTLPLEFQNVSFSGFQSEIQVGSFELIEISFSERVEPPSSGIALPKAWGRVLGRPQSGGRKWNDWFDGFDGVGTSYSSFVPSRCDTKNIEITMNYAG